MRRFGLWTVGMVLMILSVIVLNDLDKMEHVPAVDFVGAALFLVVGAAITIVSAFFLKY